MAHYLKTEALVVGAQRWQESSKIVHLFTADQGYLKVIAKGALRPKSPFRGVLETLNHLEVIVSHKESRSLQILTTASLINSFLNIREDLSKTAVAFAMLETLKKLFSTHEPVGPFFTYLVENLRELDRSPASHARGYLWHFLLAFSRTLGFGWQFETCLRCGKSPRHFPVFPDYRNGAIFCHRCRSQSGGAEVGLSRPQWEQLAALEKSGLQAPADMAAFQRLLRQSELTELLLKHLTYHTEIHLELKSLKWYM